MSQNLFIHKKKDYFLHTCKGIIKDTFIKYILTLKILAYNYNNLVQLKKKKLNSHFGYFVELEIDGQYSCGQC